MHRDTPPDLHAVSALEVCVLVDNVTDLISSVPPDVAQETESLVRAGMKEFAGENLCCAHFGLALVLRIQAGDRRHTVLFDGGPEGYAVARNGARLGIDFGAIESVVLSHGHWDHAGGLVKALELIRQGNGGREVPFYLHPEMFHRRAIRHPDGSLLPFKEIPHPRQLAALGAAPIVTREPQLISGGTFFVSGEIPRVTGYEKGLPGHVRRGADDASWDPDPWIVDERFLAVHVRDKGLVVFTACSHAGVVNVLRHARDAFPHLPLYAVCGGLHLSGEAVEPLIPRTIEDLKTFGLSRIIPGHCTGWRAVGALVNAFGESVVVPSAVGRRFRF